MFKLCCKNLIASFNFPCVSKNNPFNSNAKQDSELIFKAFSIQIKDSSYLPCLNNIRALFE